MSLIKIYVNNEIAELKEKDEITSGDISTVDIEFAFSSGGAMSRFSTISYIQNCLTIRHKTTIFKVVIKQCHSVKHHFSGFLS